MKQKLIPIISIVVGLIAFFLTMKFTSDKEAEFKKMKDAFYARSAQVTVMVATHDIPGGTLIKQTDIRKEKVFKINVGDRAVSLKDGLRIVGKKVIFPIKRGSPVFWSDIKGGDTSASGLASIINLKMRAISLSVGGAAAVSSMIKPNDHVDILGTFSMPSKTIPGEMETVTLTVSQDVTILATGQDIAKDQISPSSRSSSGYSTVTVSVTPREAELLVFAEQMQGRLTLSLRNPNDVSYESDLPEVDFDHIHTKLNEYNLYRQRYIRKKSSVR
jgi:pilus assembly protein CpaB